MSQFAFQHHEWAAVFDASARAGAAANGDPRTACCHAHRALGLAVAWAYKYDRTLPLPCRCNSSSGA